MAFLEGFSEEAPFQFDIISILIESNTAKYFFIDDAFPYTLEFKIKRPKAKASYRLPSRNQKLTA